MKILIAYATKSGTTQRAAELLAQKLEERGARCDVRDLRTLTPSPSEYDAVAAGGSIRIGMLHAKTKKWLAANQAALLQRPLGLFVCRCGKDDTKALVAAQVGHALSAHAVAVESFGGEMDLEKQKGFDRFVAKMVAGKGENSGMESGGILADRIDAFADGIMRTLEA